VAGSGRTPRNLYGGLSAGARVAARRDRLLAAGLELFGTQGYQCTAIDQVCAEAGLTKPYFYESFRSREELLGAVVRSLWSRRRNGAWRQWRRHRPSAAESCCSTPSNHCPRADRPEGRLVMDDDRESRRVPDGVEECCLGS